jgi:heteromeric Ino2p/Ino4p transcription factor
LTCPNSNVAQAALVVDCAASTMPRVTTDDHTAIGGAGDVEEKPRLSETEKKANHIASGTHLSRAGPADARAAEQKRREAIREGFDRLARMVPGMEGQGRSEGLVLGKTVEYMLEQLATRRDLVSQLEAMGEDVEEYK